MEKIFSGLAEKKADLIVLILTSQKIETRVERVNNLFNILVNESEVKKALSTVATYYKENKFFRLKLQLHKFPISSFKSYSAFGIMGLLFFIHAILNHYRIHEAYIFKYGSSALFILQGEVYRAVTALFLHSDARHLAGNMAGMIIFGAPFISIAGFGLGPFMLLFTGTLGNLFNALFYKTAHLSIGASTAIMSAAGLLAAFQLTQNKKRLQWNSLMPVLAGAVLMALFSQGERTDVWAHVFGFLSGLFSGIIFFPLNQILTFPQKNHFAVFLTLAIIAASFLAGK